MASTRNQISRRVSYKLSGYWLTPPRLAKKLTRNEMIHFFKEMMTAPSRSEIGSRILRTIYVSEVVSKMELKDRTKACVGEWDIP